MSTTKCETCNKNITKTKVGVVCGRCDKVVHLSAACAGLSNKQVSALRAAENLEWTCQECRDASPKRLSIIVPEDDEAAVENNIANSFLSGTNLQVNAQQLLKDVTREFEKTMKREMSHMRTSLETNSELVQEAIDNVKQLREAVKTLQKKNTDLTNRNNNLETRVGALEQRLHEIEQSKLSKNIEVFHVPETSTEEPTKIVKAIAGRLNLEPEHVLEAKRVSGKKDHPGPIQVVLSSEAIQDKWLGHFKQLNTNTQIKVEDIIPDAPATDKDRNIVIREALTPYNKHLLWYTKQELKNTFKYIWIKKGVIRVRKDGEKDKALIIRSTNDVYLLKAK
ncbi:hypothetical protein O0L34_g8389 [Tuta absoluta]|nr:hypothetical protein O0L34_g8389 [Tuta absoluta]